LLLAMLFNLLLGIGINFSAFGFEVNRLLSVEGGIVFLVTSMCVAVGYGLYFGKSWGVKLGLGLAVIQLVLFFGVFSLKGEIRFDYIPVLPFFFKLMNLNLVWHKPQNIEP